jgi:hypothetical protein
MAASIKERDKFDLDCGYITKSPCRECAKRDHLPQCSDGCRKLARLQTLLVGTISCSKDVAESEEYLIAR